MRTIVFTATLTPAPSTNHAYQERNNRAPGSKGKALSAEAKAWLGANNFRLRLSGKPRYPGKIVDVHVLLEMVCNPLKDIDGQKLLLDAVADHLGFNDRLVSDFHVTKARSSKKDEHKVDVRVTLFFEDEA